MPVKTLSTTEIKRLNRAWRRRSETRLALALVSLSNPYNVGSIMRSAAVFGVETVWLVGATPGPADAKVKKTGLGTESSIPTPRVQTISEAAAAARDALANHDYVRLHDALASTPPVGAVR